MVNNSEQAIIKALSITQGYGGKCLQFTRVCYNAPAKYGSAIASWNASKRKVNQTDPMKIPRGYPVYFAPYGTPYGHVGVSLGNGKFRTTNSTTGKIHTDDISKWISWGYKLLGYTLDISDIIINNESENDMATVSERQDIANRSGNRVWYDTKTKDGVNAWTLITQARQRAEQNNNALRDLQNRTTSLERKIDAILSKLQ